MGADAVVSIQLVSKREWGVFSFCTLYITSQNFSIQLVSKREWGANNSENSHESSFFHSISFQARVGRINGFVLTYLWFFSLQLVSKREWGDECFGVEKLVAFFHSISFQARVGSLGFYLVQLLVF
ncbi:hypothetical protein [Microcoleus sp. ARI1-A5]|uniref:hypothetical protein n=1 Tax=unclassified Microcoleus TaxID=2642155 RepID=UPI003FA60323